MRFQLLRAFSIGLAIFAGSEAILYFLEVSGYATEVLRLLVSFLGSFVSSLSIAILAPRFKFRMAVLLSMPASVLMGIFSVFAVATGVTPASDHDGVIFVSLMNFPFVLFACAFGSLLGCIVSFKRASGASGA